MDATTLKLNATNAAMLGEEKREKKRGWVDTATLQLNAASAAKLEEEERKENKEKGLESPLRKLCCPFVLSHVRLFVLVRVSPQRRAKPMPLFDRSQSFEGQSARRGGRFNCHDGEKRKDREKTRM